MKAVLFSLATASIMATMGCGLCSNQLVRNERSPDGAIEATWYVRNCGATTEFSTMVSLHQPNSSYTEEANLVFVAKGNRDLKLSWRSPRDLTIDCEGCPRKDIFRETTHLGDVDVTFTGP